MNNKLSFVTANLVARQVGYNMRLGWKQGEMATNHYFRTEKNFKNRFDILVQEVVSAGFNNIDLWSAHLNPKWATHQHIKYAIEILDKYNVIAVSLAGKFGDNLSEFESYCALANSLSVPLLGGIAPVVISSPSETIKLLEKYDLKLAVENHPEKAPTEILMKLKALNSELIGTTVDTGWYATHGYDASLAITRLGKYIFHVHLKDVISEGTHVTCRLGDGILPARRCVDALKHIGYKGVISIEHEPEKRNPLPECKESAELLRSFLKDNGD